jgi:hypothetical protein
VAQAALKAQEELDEDNYEREVLIDELIAEN